MAENPFRSELPDGSRIERNYRVEGDRRVGYGSWIWTVYDPDRRPSRKKVNLRTKDKGAAMGKALDYARRRSLGTFDPWDPSRKGATVDEAAEAYLESQRKAGRAESTLATAERMLDGFSRSLPAGVLVRHVEPRHVEAFVDAPKRGKKGNGRSRWGRGTGPKRPGRSAPSPPGVPRSTCSSGGRRSGPTRRTAPCSRASGAGRLKSRTSANGSATTPNSRRSRRRSRRTRSVTASGRGWRWRGPRSTSSPGSWARASR